jgi:SNF5 / SMARCB1 / INI1
MSTAVGPPADLVPICIDVCTEDGHVRIIDTLILDSNCWPIPLVPPLHESIEENVKELASTIIADAEVVGMGRTVRHFTNRVDLWSWELQELVEEQLRLQLWDIFEKKNSRDPGPNAIIKKNISLRLNVNNIQITDDFEWDNTVPGMCPLVISQSIARDLNLPSEATIAITTAILEQLHGSPISHKPSESTMTRASFLESRDHISNVAHAVALHRPKNLEKHIL